jgi:DNA repair exonuclease SbcCD ATPase subunit
VPKLKAATAQTGSVEFAPTSGVVMEETKPRPGFPGDRAQVAAEKLRALRERANQALDEHRQRLAQIESELSLRVRQLAEEFETASAGLERHSDASRDEEVVALREQLEEGRAKHEKFVDQLAIARRQLDEIQAQPCEACKDAAHQLADSQGEMARLREQLRAAEQQREEDQARHAKFTEQVAAARQAINDLQAKSHEQTAALQTELDAARGSQASAETQLAALARDMEVLHGEYDALQDRAEQLEHERASSLDEQRRAADDEIAAQQKQLAELKNELETVQRAHDSLEQRTDVLQGRLADAENDRDVLRRQKEDAERAKAEVDAELTELKAAAAKEQQASAHQAAEADAKLAAFGEALAASEGEKATLAASLSAVEAEKAKLAAALAEVEAEKKSLAGDLAEAVAERTELDELLDNANQLIATLEEAGGEIAAIKTAKAQAETEAAAKSALCEELTSVRDRLQAELDELRGGTCPQADLDALQGKFDLSLADVQKLKKENGELREELASRPEASDQESPELIAVRSERDSLISRVEELEQAVAAAAAASSSEDVDDLNRRFQMAVDDVRQLKQENASLREKLAKAPASGAGGTTPGGNDWASQRARMMAMLEQEDGPIDAARKKERASIESTIAETDRIVAEQERQIAELLASQQSQAASDSSADVARAAEAILNVDEIVVAERQRLAAMQAEWEEKQRAAELELSLERAKLAREQSALKEKLFDLQKLETQGGPAAEGGDQKQPRRRWLSALGLGEEGDDAAKPK